METLRTHAHHVAEHGRGHALAVGVALILAVLLVATQHGLG